MDLLDVFAPMFVFLEKFFAVEITLGGFVFTVGAFWMWCIVLTILILFVKGLSR